MLRGKKGEMVCLDGAKRQALGPKSEVDALPPGYNLHSEVNLLEARGLERGTLHRNSALRDQDALTSPKLSDVPPPRAPFTLS